MERLRFAIEQEEQHGVARPEIKMFTSENQLGDTSLDQEAADMEDEPIGEAETEESFTSNPSQLGNGSNGTSEGKCSFWIVVGLVLTLIYFLFLVSV